MTVAAETRSPEETRRVIDAVRSRFTVTQEYLRPGEAMEFYVDPNQQDTKSRFLSLLSELRNTGDLASLRKSDHGLYLIVFRKPMRKRSTSNRQIILLVATIIAVVTDGYLRTTSMGSFALTAALAISGIYAASLVGIIGIHELGHKVASWVHKMDSSWPYFIPGIPGIFPTFGAVITARDPPPNKDSLFDLGLSGPVAGLFATIIVSIFAAASAQVVHIPANNNPNLSFVPLDYYTSLLVGFFHPLADSASYYVTGTSYNLLYLAYSIGFLITFVNLLPAWQLDGGHIANAFVSPKVHRYLTYASVVIMVLSGFIGMAILVLLFSNMAPSLRPLDDVSPLSRGRKVLWVFTWVLSAAIYLLVIYNNAYFSFRNLF